MILIQKRTILVWRAKHPVYRTASASRKRILLDVFAAEGKAHCNQNVTRTICYALFIQKGMSTYSTKRRKSLLAWTLTSAMLEQTVATKMLFVSMNQEPTSAVARRDSTATDTPARVHQLSFLHWFNLYYLYFFPEETPCSRVRCASHSQCVETASGDPECRCLSGYQDVEGQCRPTDRSSSVQSDCRQDHRCDINAECVYSSHADQYRCKCLNGFRGDGITCAQVSGVIDRDK